jgi:TetR/AcrR family transcriptional repressor of nem operon
MADTGLTDGAFYPHFDSKDDLVASAVSDQLREQCETPGRRRQTMRGGEEILRAYLSVRHRDSPEHG